MVYLDAFFRALANGIGVFDMLRRLREKSRPGAVRKNLLRAKTAALRLNEALNDLDGNSTQLLAEVVQGRIGSPFDNVCQVILALDRALGLANDYPSSGNIPEHHRLYLAADVRDAIKTYLGIPAKCTKSGIFVAILESVVTEATGTQAKAVHELARKAVKHKVKMKSPGGLVEYIPPPKI
jgi:hypothetical protein